MKLSAQGERVVAAIAAGRVFRRTGDGWSAGALRAPDALVAELVRADLVRRNAGGLAPGSATGARAAPARPRRLLEERTLPDAIPAAPAASSRPGATPDAGEGMPARRRSVTVNLLESPLGWLKARGLVDARQYDAGERLRGDWTMAGLGPRVTMRWDAAPSGSRGRGPDAPLDPTLAGIAARRRFDGAIAHAGKGLGDVLWRVVCSGDGLEAAETALGWPRRAGKLVLLMALDRVADYYGIA